MIFGSRLVSAIYSSYNLIRLSKFNSHTVHDRQTAVAQWLGCCVTNRKVDGSIPYVVIAILPIALWPWVRLSL